MSEERTWISCELNQAHEEIQNPCDKEKSQSDKRIQEIYLENR